MENPSEGLLASAREEACKLLSHFKHVKDLRQEKKVRFPLDEVLFLMVVASAADQDAHTDIEDWGKAKLPFLRHFLAFENGIPTHGTIGNINSKIPDEDMEKGYASWCRSQGLTVEADDLRVILPWRRRYAIDGKYERGSHDRKKGKGAEVMVSAVDVDAKRPVAQVAVASKSNEIKAIPKILELLGNIEKCIVTMDAMGAQRDICQDIVRRKGDYVVGLKGNQGTLHEDLKLFVAEQKPLDWRDTEVSKCSVTGQVHGRTETRSLTVIKDVEWIQRMHNWPGLKSVAVMESVRETVYAEDELDLAGQEVEEPPTDKEPPACMKPPTPAKVDASQPQPPVTGGKPPSQAKKKAKPETKKKLKKPAKGVKRTVRRNTNGTVSVKEEEMRFFLASLYLPAAFMLLVILGHWGVESFHWILDVIWRADASRLRTGFGVRNFSIIRKIAYCLVRKREERLNNATLPGFNNISMRRCRKQAAYSDMALVQMLM